jgi:uncharacterized protein YegP (UPF0339 family)
MIRHVTAFVAVVALSLSAVACAGSPDEAATTSQDVSATSNGKFELFKGTDGDFYFRFVAANGETVLQSEGYTTKASATSGIDAVIADAPDTHNVQVLESTSSKFYFVVKAGNGEIIATSQMYATKASAQRSALTVRQLTRAISDDTATN